MDGQTRQRGYFNTVNPPAVGEFCTIRAQKGHII